MNWVKAIVIALAAGVIGFVVQQRSTFEDDPTRSLKEVNPAEYSLYAKYHVASPFQSKLYFDRGEARDGDIEEFVGRVQSAGYTPASLFGVKGDWSDLMLLAPALISPSKLDHIMSPTGVAERVDDARNVVWLPTGAAYLAVMDQDPLGLSRAMIDVGIKNLGMSGARMGGGAMLVYDSPKTISYDEVENVWSAWEKISAKTHAISGDFFSLANYRAIRRDIALTMLLSLPLNFLLFWYFVRRWEFLAFLALGTVVSYGAGLIALGAGGGAIFTIVIGFTSTFVSFNNEYMVHLCGLDPAAARRSRMALGSAIGTTLIGFFVLLLADSVIIRQMALVSIGAMAGFLGYLYAFRERLGEIRLRSLDWRRFQVSSRALLIVSAVLIVAMIVAGLPPLKTEVKTFGVTTPLLERESAYFSDKAERIGAGDVYGIEVGKDVFGVFERLRGRLGDQLKPHPLSMYRDVTQQREAIDTVLKPRYLSAVRDTIGTLARDGIRVGASTTQAPSFRPVGPEEFLTRLSLFLPAPVWIEDAGQSWLIFSARQGSVDLDELKDIMGREIVPLSPKIRHDVLLTGLSRQFAWLFALGIAAMGIYLYALHRRWDRLLYIGFPLLASLAVFFAVLRLTGNYNLNIIHLMGFSLVIALAVDYSSIAISTAFRAEERTKILVTGLSTLASFGVLILARHPVLRDLGIVVTIGCGVSLLCALMLDLVEGDEA